MILVDLIVVLAGLGVLLLWTRSARRSAEIREKQEVERLHNLRDDVDRLIEAEIAGLPPDEQAKARQYARSRGVPLKAK